MPHPAALPEEELLPDLRFEATRASGPGGQHRNRVATGVRVTHLPTGIRAAATERRSARDNRREALFRLRKRLALEWRSPLDDASLVPPEAYRPSEAWLRRRRGERVQASPNHADFPALLAEVLDRLHADEDDLARTARAFGVSRSQLVKFLALEPAALAAVNARRRARGEHPLRA